MAAEGAVGQLKRDARAVRQVGVFFQNGGDGLVAVARKVLTKHVAAVAVQAGQGRGQVLGQPAVYGVAAHVFAQVGKAVVPAATNQPRASGRLGCAHALLNQRQAQVRTTALAGHGVQLFSSRVAIKPVRRCHPLVFIGLRPRNVLAHANALVQAVLHRALEGDAVHVGFQRPALLARAHVLHQLVEGVFHTVVGADDAHLVAPQQHGHCGLQQRGQVAVKGGFVDDDHALLAAQVGGPAAQRHHTVARAGEDDLIGLDVAAVAFGVVTVVVHAFACGARCHVEGAGPQGTGLNVFTRHVLRGADVEDLAAAV